MNRKNTEHLIITYPYLYAGVTKSPIQSLMCFGFECGNGWFKIIDELSRKITEISQHCEAVQVKEKFGGLRFYIQYRENESEEVCEKVYKLIDEAEDESFETCEICGTKEKVETSGDGWISTLCENCRKMRDEDSDSFRNKLYEGE